MLCYDKNSSIHIVGIAGTESTAVLNFLLKKGYTNIVLHDFGDNLTERFNRNHQFYPSRYKDELLAAIGSCSRIRTGRDYLDGIESSDVIYAPQSWFIYAENKRLFAYQNKLAFFIDLCFSLFKGKVIGITGTVGKSTTALYTSLLTGGLLTGNDRENVLNLEKIETSHKQDVLVFELSNRHLYNGFQRVIDVAILTNICPNHIPDHGSLQHYAEIKNSIFKRAQVTIYNRHNPYADLKIIPQGTAYSYSARGDAYGYIEGDQIIIEGKNFCLLNKNFGLTGFEKENLVAGIIAARQLGISDTQIINRLSSIKQKLLYRNNIYQLRDLTIINNGAACLPINTVRLLENVNEPSVLIIGGSRQAPLDTEFDVLAQALSQHKYIRNVYIFGDMKGKIYACLKEQQVTGVQMTVSLAQAVEKAVETKNRLIIFSPGCGPASEFNNKYERGRCFDRVIRKILSV